MAFRFEPLGLEGLALVRPEVHEDGRGSFRELFVRSSFREAGLEADFVQDNLSRSREGVLRGLHFQRPPHAQAKLVRAVRGEVFDVAVDLRSGSGTRGEWVGRRLSAPEAEMLYVPEGFAHGFCVTGGPAEVHYKVSAEYAPEAEGGLRWDDPEVAIDWPVEEPVLSERDAALPGLRDLEPDLF